jgi:glycosyltransferase involved in cell wall biosynthesis
MKTKILYLITHLELGGAQTQVLALIRGLDKSCYQVYLCSGDKGYLTKTFSQESKLMVKLIPTLVRKINPIKDFMAFWAIFSYIKANQFDIVHVHSPKASFLGRWAAFFAGTKKIIYTVHGWSFHSRMNKLAYYFYLWLEKITALITTKIIVVSRNDLQIGLAKVSNNQNKFSLIHYGIDISCFNRIFSCRQNTESGEYLVVNVSCFKPQKDLGLFLRVCRRLLDSGIKAKFVIAGDGQQRRFLEQQINRLNLQENVELLGWVDDLPELLSRASLYVLTSLWEGLPVSLIEARIAGVPAVVTDTGGVSDFIKQDKGAVCVPCADETAVFFACDKILRDHSSWKKIKYVDQERGAEYWSCVRMIEQIVTNVYR